MKKLKEQARPRTSQPVCNTTRADHSSIPGVGISASFNRLGFNRPVERPIGSAASTARPWLSPASHARAALSKRFAACGLAFLFAACVAGKAQTSPGQNNSAQQLVREVIHNELAANQTDHTKWIYRDADKTASKDVVQLVVETPEASVSKTIERNGQPLTPQERQQDQAKMETVVNDPAVRAKQRKDAAHDDKQAVSLMKMLPEGFLWSKAGESNGEITLNFKPNPDFEPPTYASRVFAAMSGTMVVDAKQKRLKMLSGTLIQPVEFGWGILGKLRKGGTFRIVRSEVAPGEWQITQTHVHIEGHALFFKSISEQEDEITSDYKRAPAGITLQKAAQMLNDGTVEKELGITPQK